MSEPLPSVATIVEYLNEALDDLKDTGDYLSYATLIDVHLSDASRFSSDEKVTILNELNRICAENPDIVYEIGWDFPELILGYLDGELLTEGLRSSPAIVSAMHSFEMLAKNGNPKEIFIKVIEVLGSFSFPDKDQDEEVFAESDRVCDIKIHILFELLNSSLKRINTIYPSNFLGMALGAILKFVDHYMKHSVHCRFVLRRSYTFIRDYIPPLKPLNYIKDNDLTEEEAEKIDDDENYLQRVLLQSFITHLYSIYLQKSSCSLSFKYYHNLQLTKKGQLPVDYNAEVTEIIASTYTVFLRLLTLSLSFDFDFEHEFAKLQDDSLDLFSKIDDSKNDDDKIQDLIKFSINDWISTLYHPESKSIPKSSSGLLILCSQFRYEDLELPINTHKLVLLTIRFLSPGLLSENFRSFGILDALLYLNWSNITDPSKLEDYKTIPRYQINLFLQIIIFYSSITNDPSVGLVSYTLLTRVLTLISEDKAYDFLMDTLTTAPFQNAKMAIISILKDLILRNRLCENEIDGLNKKLEHTKLDSGNESSASSDSTVTPPTLPKRTFITLNKSRVGDIYALVRESIEETLSEDDKYDEISAKLTLGYLNLLIGLRRVYPVEEQIEISKILESKLQKQKENTDNILHMIRIANESLSSFAKKSIN